MNTGAYSHDTTCASCPSRRRVEHTRGQRERRFCLFTSGSEARVETRSGHASGPPPHRFTPTNVGDRGRDPSPCAALSTCTNETPRRTGTPCRDRIHHRGDVSSHQDSVHRNAPRRDFQNPERLRSMSPAGQPEGDRRAATDPPALPPASSVRHAFTRRVIAR